MPKASVTRHIARDKQTLIDLQAINYPKNQNVSPCIMLKSDL